MSLVGTINKHFSNRTKSGNCTVTIHNRILSFKLGLMVIPAKLRPTVRVVESVE